jgi:hypothetical protein
MARGPPRPVEPQILSAMLNAQAWPVAGPNRRPPGCDYGGNRCFAFPSFAVCLPPGCLRSEAFVVLRHHFVIVV